MHERDMGSEKGRKVLEQLSRKWSIQLEEAIATVSMDIQSNLKHVYSWNYYTMKFIGIWPEERKWNRASSYQVLIPVLTMLCFVNVPQTINLPLIWGNMDLVVENLSMGNITFMISVLKTIAFWVNGKALKSLLECMAKDWSQSMPEENRESMKVIAVITRKIVTRSTIMCNTVVVCYCALRYFSIKYTDNKLFFSGYFPYDINVSPNYELTVVAQCVASFYAAIAYTGVDTFVAMLILHVCGQLTNLRKDIKLLSVRNKVDFRTKLESIVRKHEYLSRFTATIENCFNLMLLFQIIGSTVQLCFQSFQAITSFGVQKREQLIFQMNFLLIYVTYAMLHLYLYCYVGERLVVESSEIANAAYNSEWYNLSTKNSKLFVLIIRRAKVPLQITAGRFCSFTLELYFQILKTSAGYISVLWAMKNK